MPFEQSLYLLIKLFQAYTFLGLLALRLRDALPPLLFVQEDRQHQQQQQEQGQQRLLLPRSPAAAPSSSSSSPRFASSASFSTSSPAVAIIASGALGAAAAASWKHLTKDQQRILLDQVHHLHRIQQDHPDQTALIHSLKQHAYAVQEYHTFVHFQRTAGVQPSLTARLPGEIVRKILLHAGIPTRRASRSPYELPGSPVAILSLSRAYHATLLPRVYQALVIDRPPLFRSIRLTLSQRPILPATAATSSSPVHLPQPGDHIQHLHIGSALFGSTFANLMNSGDDDDDDLDLGAIADHRRRSSRARQASVDDSADSDEEGYLPSHLASNSALHTGIEQILLAAPHLRTLSLDLFTLTALQMGNPRRFSRAPRPQVLRCELAIPQSLSLRIFRDVQAVELLCFGMDPGSAIELCAALPRGCTELTLRFVRRRRTYAATGATGATRSSLGGLSSLRGLGHSAAARAQQATRSLFGLGRSANELHRDGVSTGAGAHMHILDADEDEEDEDEEDDDDDFHSAHETEEAVRNLASAVRVLQFSGRSPSLFSFPPPAPPPPPPASWTAYSSSSPSSSQNTHLPAAGPTASGSRRPDSYISATSGRGSPFSTPRTAHAMLSSSPGSGTASGHGHGPYLSSSPMLTRSPALASVMLGGSGGGGEGGGVVGAPNAGASPVLVTRPARVSEFFHPDAVPPPNSVIRLHSTESSLSSLVSSEDDEEDEDEEADDEEEEEEEALLLEEEQDRGEGPLGLVSSSRSSSLSSGRSGSALDRAAGGLLGLDMGATRRTSEDASVSANLLGLQAGDRSSFSSTGSAAIPIPGLESGSSTGRRRAAREEPILSFSPSEPSSLVSAAAAAAAASAMGTTASLATSSRPLAHSPSNQRGPSTRHSSSQQQPHHHNLYSSSPSNAAAAAAAILAPELTLNHIRVLAWPAALKRLRQLLPDAQRIMDEPSGMDVFPVSGGGGGPVGKGGKVGKGAAAAGKGKGKARGESELVGERPEFMTATTRPPTAGSMPVLGPYPASLSVGLDSVHARGPRRGVQELWSAWAREGSGETAI
ncbi:hypothetical protein V8E36_009415 [Tilletia maclaganii]